MSLPTKPNLPVATLRRLLSYSPETGEFRWRVSPATYIPAGSVAGRTGQGRRQICINGTLYLAHRLAWLMSHGSLSGDAIDHINGDPMDNRLANLRLCSPSQNAANKGVNSLNTSGFKGVTWHKGCRKWQAQIKLNGKNYHLGLFDDAKVAHAAYLAKAKELFGEFARVA